MEETMRKLVEIVIEACERDGNHELAKKLKAYQKEEHPEEYIMPVKKVSKKEAKKLYPDLYPKEAEFVIASEVSYESYTLKGKPIKIKRVYVHEAAPRARDMNSWFKKGLKAKKILKYKLDEYSFRWIVWYI